MTPDRMDEASHRTEPVTTNRPITRQDIQAVLSDPGYSANERRGRLSELLTALAKQHDEPSNRELIDEIKDILADQQSGKPIAEDTL